MLAYLKRCAAMATTENKSGLTLEPYQIVYRPLITEKGTHLSTRYNAYPFEVNPLCTKTEIKEAVEKIYEVAVKNVTVMNVKGKVKRNIRGTTRKPSWKKAYVRLEDGHDIDFS
jgi:large subunit ribosomal protein L23